VALATFARSCPHCGAVLPGEGATCQSLFDELLVREYQDFAWGKAHLLSVDAYILQHPENHGPRSNAFHLLRLCLILEHGAPFHIGAQPPRDTGKQFETIYQSFPKIEAPENRGAITISDILAAKTPEEHVQLAQQWARSVWEAYAQHHEWARHMVLHLKAVGLPQI
jgi:hypothetical protein